MLRRRYRANSLISNLHLIIGNPKTLCIIATSNKPDFIGNTFHQTYPTAVKGHYGGIVSRPV